MNITSWCHLIGACHIVVLETVSGSCVIEVRHGRCGTYIQLVKYTSMESCSVTVHCRKLHM